MQDRGPLPRQCHVVPPGIERKPPIGDDRVEGPLHGGGTLASGGRVGPHPLERTRRPQRREVQQQHARIEGLRGGAGDRSDQVPAELGDNDSPLVPSRFQNLIVDGAARRGYYDDDEPDMAQAVEAERQSGISLMVSSLLSQQHDEPFSILDQSDSMDW